MKYVMRYQQEIKCLGFFEETNGVLTELTEDEGILIARIGKVNLALPIEMENKLRPLIGVHVGCPHTDIPGKPYLVRVISEFGMKTETTTDQNHCENKQSLNCCEVT